MNDIITVKTLEELSLAVQDENIVEIILDSNIYYNNFYNYVLDFTVNTDKYIHCNNGIASLNFNNDDVVQAKVSDFQRSFYIKNNVNFKLENINIIGATAKRDCDIPEGLDRTGYGAGIFIENGNVDLINCSFDLLTSFNNFLYLQNGNLYLFNCSITNSVLKNNIDVYQQAFIYSKHYEVPNKEYGILTDINNKPYHLSKTDFFNLSNRPGLSTVTINNKTYSKSFFTKYTIGSKFFTEYNESKVGLPNNFLANFTDIFIIDFRNKDLIEIGDNFCFNCTSLKFIENFNHLISDKT